MKKKTNKNVVFYRKLDSIYNSFWLGKLMNFYIKHGKKNLIYKQFYKSFFYFKYNCNISPFLYILEILAQAKPLFFKLYNWMFRRKTIQYPRIASETELYKVALKWFYLYLKNFKIISITRIKTPFSIYMFENINNFQSIKKIR